MELINATLLQNELLKGKKMQVIWQLTVRKGVFFFSPVEFKWSVIQLPLSLWRKSLEASGLGRRNMHLNLCKNGERNMNLEMAGWRWSTSVSELWENENENRICCLEIILFYMLLILLNEFVWSSFVSKWKRNLDFGAKESNLILKAAILQQLYILKSSE